MKTLNIIFSRILLLITVTWGAGTIKAQDVLTKNELSADKRHNYFKKAENFLLEYYNNLPDGWRGDAEVRGGFRNHYFSDNAMVVPETPQGIRTKEFIDAARYLMALDTEYGKQGNYKFQVKDIECHPDIIKTSLFSCAVKLQYMLSIYKDDVLLSESRKVATLEFPDLKVYFNVKIKQLEPNEGRSIMLERYQSPDEDEDDENKLHDEQLSALYNLALAYYWDFDFNSTAEERKYQEEEGYTLLQFPNGTDGDRQKAFDLFKKAAEQGHKKAMLYLGKYYRTGRYVPKDLDKAAYWLEKAGEDNFVACYELGKCYRSLGRWPEAVENFKRAAEKGLFYWACIHLVDIYKIGGYGVAPSSEQRKYWEKEKKTLKKLRELIAGFKQKDEWAYLD